MRALLLLLCLPHPSLAHPGADAHLHATEADRCIPEVHARRLSALIDESRLGEARTELEASRSCPTTKPAVAVAEGELLRLEGDPAAAIAVLSAVLVAEPTHSGALEQRAAAHLDLQQPAAAAADLHAIARAHPAAIDAWIQAHGTALRAGDHALAKQIFSEADKASESAPSLLWTAAEQLLEAGDPRGTLAVLVLAPDALRTWLLRADAHRALGEPEEAGALDRARQHANTMRPSPARTEILATLQDRMAPL